jgi:UDP-N-acetylmuramoyl-tripeptide--D-alanyl-D-alanine ligase
MKRYTSIAEQRGIGFIVVENTLRALQDLAAYHLDHFPDLVRIGITGSNGKTTTKEIIGSILSHVKGTIVNQGNMNSETGLPLSAFRVDCSHHFAVFEMAMNHAGEMDDLARIVRPAYALITNIGSAHIEFLGSKDRIAQEKKKIFQHFSGRETGFLYEGEAYYDFLKEGIRGEIISFGPKSTKGFNGSKDLGLDGTAIDWEGLQVRFPLFGFHNLLNALSAITLTTNLGADMHAVKKGLEETKPLFGRSQIIRGCITVIHDCYNANPDSMETVLDFLSNLHWSGRKVVVLGSMLELGNESAKAHLEVARRAVMLRIDLCFLFGKEMEEAFQALKEENIKLWFYWTDNFDTLLAEVIGKVKAGDLVLIKGSRGVRLERLVEPLLKIAA